MLLNFYQLNNRQDAGQFTASSVPLIPKFMGILRTEYPSWVCPYAMIDGHGIAEADFPRVKGDGSHVVIPYLYHMVNFPKLINIGWEVSVSEPKFKSDGVKSAFRHELLETIGGWICP